MIWLVLNLKQLKTKPQFGWIGVHHRLLDTHALSVKNTDGSDSSWVKQLSFLSKPEHLVAIQMANQHTDVYLSHKHLRHVESLEDDLGMDWGKNQRSGMWQIFTPENEKKARLMMAMPLPLDKMKEKSRLVRSIHQYAHHVYTLMKEVAKDFPNLRLESKQNGHFSPQWFEQHKHYLKQSLLQEMGHLFHLIQDLHSPFHTTQYVFGWDIDPITGAERKKAHDHNKAPFHHSMHGFTELTAFRLNNETVDKGERFLSGFLKPRPIKQDTMAVTLETLDHWLEPKLKDTYMQLFKLAKVQLEAFSAYTNKQLNGSKTAEQRYLERLAVGCRKVAYPQFMKAITAQQTLLWNLWQEAGRPDLNTLEWT